MGGCSSAGLVHVRKGGPDTSQEGGGIRGFTYVDNIRSVSGHEDVGSSLTRTALLWQCDACSGQFWASGLPLRFGWGRAAQWRREAGHAVEWQLGDKGWRSSERPR